MKGIIFDFNGTMLFDEAFQSEAWRAFIGQLTNRTISEEDFQEYVNGRNSGVALTHFLNKALTEQEIMELEEEKEKIYRRLCLESPDFHLAEGLPDFLDAIKRRNLPLTIATASAWGNVKFFFEHLQLNRWFRLSDVVYNDGTVRGKPEPDYYLKAADVIGVSAADCTVFEDSKSGLIAAKRAGIGQIIGITSSLEANVLMENGATRTIGSFRELL